ncbi:MAG: thioredoxin family protein [Candidatus Aerophobetes bacterium]|nr:thioredoxin family protein [Candidatus Aerophobetes bacterium]
MILSVGDGKDSNIFALAEGKVRMFMFYAEGCQHCHSIINEFLPELKKKYGPIIEVKYFEINEPKNYKLWTELEKEYKDTGNEVPTIFIDNYVLGNWQEVEENLDSVVGECISKGGCDWPSLPEVVTKVKDISSDSNKTIYLAYFSQPGCKECQRVRYLVKSLKQEYGNLQVKEYDLSFEENKELEVALCMKYGIPRKKWLVSPVIFIGEDYLLENKVNNDNLETLFSRYNEIRATPPWELKGKELSEARRY